MGRCGEPVVARRIVEATGQGSILTLVTSRPEGCPACCPATVCGKSSSPLFLRASKRDFVGSVLGQDESVVELARLIADRTGGIPLFVEEVVR